MFSLHLITVSKPTGPWLELIELYRSRLVHLARFHYTVIPSEKIISSSSREQVLTREGERIIKALPKECVVVACDELGKAYTTQQFTERLEHWSIQQTEPIVFVIGGPLGLSPAVKHIATATLGLAPWTLPHDLAAVVLLEQLYRVMTITHGQTYHY